MAFKKEYDASNDVVIGDTAKNERGDIIRVTNIEGKSIDVRNFYTDDKGDIYPAKGGGVRMGFTTTCFVITDMIKGLDKALAKELVLGLYETYISE